MGERLGLPTVAVQPVYCLSPHDAPRLKLMAAIDLNCPLKMVPEEALPGGGDPSIDLHWLSPDEMVKRFSAFPGALAEAGKIAARSGATLPEGRSIWSPPALPRNTDRTHQRHGKHTPVWGR